MDNTVKYTLKFYIALFSSVISHSLILLLIFSLLPNFKLERKTIPFQLISNDKAGQLPNSSQLSKSENTLAAQEFLRTLNESSFEQLIRANTRESIQNQEPPSPFKQDLPSDNFQFEQPTFKKNSNSTSAFQGLQDIFTKKELKQHTKNNIQQISSKTLEQLTQYETQLIQIMAQKGLYDEFHPVMAKNKHTNIEYIITLHLFQNGAVKTASIRQSSGIEEIDQLAVKTAYLASPFPKPPSEDINKSFKYDIPIIYQKRNTN